jgi:hypothetical protein
MKNQTEGQEERVNEDGEFSQQQEVGSEQQQEGGDGQQEQDNSQQEIPEVETHEIVEEPHIEGKVDL